MKGFKQCKKEERVIFRIDFIIGNHREGESRVVDDLLSVLCFLLYKSVTGIEAPIGNSSLSISAAGSNVNSSLSL